MINPNKTTQIKRSLRKFAIAPVLAAVVALPAAAEAKNIPGKQPASPEAVRKQEAKEARLALKGANHLTHRLRGGMGIPYWAGRVVDISSPKTGGTPASGIDKRTGGTEAKPGVSNYLYEVKLNPPIISLTGNLQPTLRDVVEHKAMFGKEVIDRKTGLPAVIPKSWFDFEATQVVASNTERPVEYAWLQTDKIGNLTDQLNSSPDLSRRKGGPIDGMLGATSVTNNFLEAFPGTDQTPNHVDAWPGEPNQVEIEHPGAKG
jgi:hypothetical protein